MGGSGLTNFAPPLLQLRDTIRDEKVKELMVVFLTDGHNQDTK